MRRSVWLRHCLLMALPVLALPVFLMVVFPNPLGTSAYCSDEDRKYANFWNNYYDPVDAYTFGIRIKHLVTNRDLAGLFDLVEGELQNGPRRSFIENRTFDQVFTEEWRTLVLESEAPCQPVGWRGFMLGHGMIWFQFGSDSSEVWHVFAINGAAEEDHELAPADPAWRVEGRIVPHQCFVKEWLSSDNIKAYAKTFRIADYEDFSKNTGQYFGREIDRLDPINAPRGDDRSEKVQLAALLDVCGSIDDGLLGSSRSPPAVDEDHVSTEVCYGEDRCGRDAYRLLAPISQSECRNLAPHLPGQCEHAYLVRIEDYTGGSMGPVVRFNIYGLFILDDARKAIVPLINFDNENEARNFVDGLGSGR